MSIQAYIGATLSSFYRFFIKMEVKNEMENWNKCFVGSISVGCL